MSCVMNPFSRGNVDELSMLIRLMGSEGLSPAELSELDDQIEATIPALVELRDQGFLELDARAIVNAGRLETMARLAEDTRLSDLSRRRCAAMRDRMLVLGVKALLVHLRFE